MKKSTDYQEKVSVNFDLSTLDRLKAFGTRRGGQSVSSLLRYAVTEMLDREENTKPAA
jgi:hypothetical protein